MSDEADNSSRLQQFFEEAYWLQHGEYYPQTHQANVEKLCGRYPWEAVIIDSLYRVTCHFDFVLEQAAKRVASRQISAPKGFEELNLPIFFYIPDSLKKLAWKNSPWI